MKYLIKTPEDLGLLLRATRKQSRVRQDDLAAIAGVSKQFAADVERGKTTVQLGLVLKLLHEAGVALNAVIPDLAVPQYDRLKALRNAAAPEKNA